MEQRCTCGAVLPDDARFCHKCGKPQYEDDQVRLAENTVAAVPVQAPIEPPGTSGKRSGSSISFSNSRAVVTSMLVAAGAMVGFPLFALFAAPLFPFFLCAIGYIAVRIYRARSTESVSASAGARLGWMTGFWLFLVVAIMITLSSIYVATPEGWEQMRRAWAQFPQTASLMHLSQHDFLMQTLYVLPFSFFLLILLPGVGGMLGAKFPAHRRQA